jgi:hypothetical protein
MLQSENSWSESRLGDQLNHVSTGGAPPHEGTTPDALPPVVLIGMAT